MIPGLKLLNPSESSSGQKSLWLSWIVQPQDDNKKTKAKPRRHCSFSNQHLLVGFLIWTYNQQLQSRMWDSEAAEQRNGLIWVQIWVGPELTLRVQEDPGPGKISAEQQLDSDSFMSIYICVILQQVWGLFLHMI